MTYNVFSGTLNPTQSINLATCCFADGQFADEPKAEFTGLRYWTSLSGLTQAIDARVEFTASTAICVRARRKSRAIDNKDLRADPQRPPCFIDTVVTPTVSVDLFAALLQTYTRLCNKYIFHEIIFFIFLFIFYSELLIHNGEVTSHICGRNAIAILLVNTSYCV